jgi:hypothetical protein
MDNTGKIFLILFLISLVGNIYFFNICTENNILELQQKASQANRVPILEDKIDKLENDITNLEKKLNLFMVTVSGTASTTGPGTRPVGIVFEDGNIKHIAPVENGKYSIILQNNVTYSVFIQWTIIGDITISRSKADDWTLSSDSKSITKNFEA